MRQFLQDVRGEFDKGQADAERAVRTGRLSMHNAVRISLSAYWPAGLVTLVGVPVFRLLLHWSVWTSMGGGVALGVLALGLVTRWINRALDRAQVRDPRPAKVAPILDEAL
jgi:hypothetical protein